jgi:hypothetical protein
MVTTDDVFTGMKRLNEVLNMADAIQAPIMNRCMEVGESLASLDPIQAMSLTQDIIKILQPLNDKLLELQTVALFREMQPPGNPANYPEPNL